VTQPRGAVARLSTYRRPRWRARRRGERARGRSMPAARALSGHGDRAGSAGKGGRRRGGGGRVARLAAAGAGAAALALLAACAAAPAAWAAMARRAVTVDRAPALAHEPPPWALAEGALLPARADELALELFGEEGSAPAALESAQARQEAELAPGSPDVGAAAEASAEPVAKLDGSAGSEQVEELEAAGGSEPSEFEEPAELQAGSGAYCQRVAKNGSALAYDNPYLDLLGERGQELLTPAMRQLAGRCTLWQRGSAPLVISIPHNAFRPVPASAALFAVRNSGGVAVNVSSTEGRLRRSEVDMHTHEFGAKLAEALQVRHGVRPFLVSARFNRKFVDVNRLAGGSRACCEGAARAGRCSALAEPPADEALAAAFEQLAGSSRRRQPQQPSMMTAPARAALALARRVAFGRAVYDGYHARMLDSLREGFALNSSRPLLVLDIHGQRASSNETLGITAEDMRETIIVGTQDGRLVRDRVALYQPGGLLRELAARGVKLFPGASSVADHPSYNGGHISAEYGYHSIRGLESNALQLEIGAGLRYNPALLQRTVTALADALAAILAQHAVGIPPAELELDA
jgi:N-formylglutamate amidohydrolase